LGRIAAAQCRQIDKQLERRAGLPIGVGGSIELAGLVRARRPSRAQHRRVASPPARPETRRDGAHARPTHRRGPVAPNVAVEASRWCAPERCGFAPVKSVPRFAIQSVNQEPAGTSCGEDLTVAGLALAAVAVFSSITPLATMASSTATARACAAPMWRIGSN